MVTGVTPPWTPPDFSDQTAREGSLAFRNASSSRDRRRVGQCKRRQRARPKAAFECSGSQAVNSLFTIRVRRVLVVMDVALRPRPMRPTQRLTLWAMTLRVIPTAVAQKRPDGRWFT